MKRFRVLALAASVMCFFAFTALAQQHDSDKDKSKESHSHDSSSSSGHSGSHDSGSSSGHSGSHDSSSSGHSGSSGSGHSSSAASGTSGSSDSSHSGSSGSGSGSSHSGSSHSGSTDSSSAQSGSSQSGSYHSHDTWNGSGDSSHAATGHDRTGSSGSDHHTDSGQTDSGHGSSGHSDSGHSSSHVDQSAHSREGSYESHDHDARTWGHYEVHDAHGVHDAHLSSHIGNVDRDHFSASWNSHPDSHERDRAFEHVRVERAQFRHHVETIHLMPEHRVVLTRVRIVPTTYYYRRSIFYNAYGWAPPAYVYSGYYPRYGLWDAVFLAFALDHIADEEYALMIYNHRNDPEIRAWMADSDRLAAENADLRNRLDEMNAQMARLRQAGTTVDPSYVPPDAQDVALSPDVINQLTSK